MLPVINKLMFYSELLIRYGLPTFSADYSSVRKLYPVGNLICTLLASAFLLISVQIARADIVADWGTVLSSSTTESTFNFAQYDISQNFNDEYAFSLEGSSGSVYEVFFSFDSCRNGCGSPELSYGIYDSNGGLIGTSTENGSVTLNAGNYVFQVKGTGMGSGNYLDYNGSITFSAVAVDMVSPAPEPGTLLLLLLGIPWLFWRELVTRNRLGKSFLNHWPPLGRI